MMKIFFKIRSKITNFIEKKLRPFYIKKLAKLKGGRAEFGKNIRIGKDCYFDFNHNSILIISDNVVVKDNCKIVLYPSARIAIGNNSYIGPSCEIFSRASIEIGTNVLLAQQCILIDYNHQYDKGGVKIDEFKTAPIEIDNNSWLGLRVVVLKGVEIGEGAIIGAQEIIRKDVPAHSLFSEGTIKNL